MDLIEKTIETKEIFKGKIINLSVDKVILPNGKEATREVVSHPGGVCLASLTQENELMFVKQFRYPYKEVVLELPAGKLELGQDPLENGKRELKEEVGAIAKEYVSLGSLYPSPGYCGEIIHLFFCRITQFVNTCPDDDEFLDIIKIPIEEAVDMVLNNEIPDAKSQTAILKTSMLIKRGII